MVEKHKLRVGEEVLLKPYFTTDIKEVLYAGMPNKETYSLVFINKDGYKSWGYNLFFPKTQGRIRIGKLNIQVSNVTPEDILLEYLRE